MRFGIFSDVHGNLPALEAVMQDMVEQEVPHTICLGDVLGGNNPGTCLEIIRAMGCPWVKGNHDRDTLDDWAEGQDSLVRMMRSSGLTLEQRSFVDSLPLVKRVHDFTIVHSSLHDPEEFNYVHSCEAARRSFLHQETPLCFFGHTHIPTIFVNETPVREFSFKVFQPNTDHNYLVNVGSVGNPRDGDKRAAYVIYDNDQNVIELRRLPFDSIR